MLTAPWFSPSQFLDPLGRLPWFPLSRVHAGPRLRRTHLLQYLHLQIGIDVGKEEIFGITVGFGQVGAKIHQNIKLGIQRLGPIWSVWQRVWTPIITLQNGLSGKVWAGDVKNKAKDGSIYWVSSVVVPFLNAQGKPYQFVSIRTVITDIKELDEQLKAKQEETQTLLDHLPAAVFVKDLEGKYLLANLEFEKSFGIKRDRAIGSYDKEIWPEHTLDKMREEEQKP